MTAIYLALSTYLQYGHGGWAAIEKHAFARVFDGITLAGSTILLIGLVEPKVLTALGSTKPFLFFAAIAGIIYAIHALRPRP